MAANDVQVVVRVPSEIVQRLERLIGVVAARPEAVLLRVNRSLLLRMAILAGCDQLELEYLGQEVAEASRKARATSVVKARVRQLYEEAALKVLRQTNPSRRKEMAAKFESALGSSPGAFDEAVTAPYVEAGDQHQRKLEKSPAERERNFEKAKGRVTNHVRADLIASGLADTRPLEIRPEKIVPTKRQPHRKGKGRNP